MSSPTNTTYTDADDFITYGTRTATTEEIPAEGCSICRMPFASAETPQESDAKCVYPVKIIGCPHVFGIPCLQEWTDVGATCPLCRKVLFVEEEVASEPPSLAELIMGGGLSPEGAREFLVDSLGHAMGLLGVCEEEGVEGSGSEEGAEGGETGTEDEEL